MNRLEWTLRVIVMDWHLEIGLIILQKLHYKTPKIIETIEDYLENREKISQGFKITDSKLIVIP